MTTPGKSECQACCCEATALRVALAEIAGIAWASEEPDTMNIDYLIRRASDRLWNAHAAVEDATLKRDLLKAEHDALLAIRDQLEEAANGNA